MTQEEKQLLLIDLCARFPYGVKAHTKIGTDITVLGVIDDTVKDETEDSFDISFVKPYLRPMSSMTEDENELFKRLKNEVKNSDGTLFIANCNLLQRFFRSRHIDNNHLIESGLAIEAPEGMYKNE